MKTILYILTIVLVAGCNNPEYIISRSTRNDYVKEFSIDPYSCEYTNTLFNGKRFKYYKNASKAIDIIKENDKEKNKYQIIEVNKRTFIRYLKWIKQWHTLKNE